MKKIIYLSTAFFLEVMNTNAQLASDLHTQVKIYETNHVNIGFGKQSNCLTEPYMDFCVNGPLVGENQLPVGGYIDNSVQKKDWSNPVLGGGNFSIDNAILGLDLKGKMYMVPISESLKIPQSQWAIQNGPILVKNKINTRGSSQSKYSRSGIGCRFDGTVIVIISLEPITFYDFAELFIEQNCVDALYLDGGPYVGYADKTGNYGTLQPDATKLQFFNN